MRKRVTTGSTGLDDMMDGGIPEGNQIIVIGGPGSGKTLMGFSYLYKNILDGNNGLFFSIEEKTDSIIENARDVFTKFKDIDKFIKQEKLIFYEQNLQAFSSNESTSQQRSRFSSVISELASTIKRKKVKRVVIDSIALLRILLKDPLEYRAMSISFVSILRDSGATTMFTLEEDPTKSIYLPELYSYDGIIRLTANSEYGKTTPTVEVVKMRGTRHSYFGVPYQITNEGIKLSYTKSKGK